MVINEMVYRKYRIMQLKNFNNYFMDCEQLGRSEPEEKIFAEHDNEYLTICYWNLREKYIRGQKDFTKDVWEKLDKFYKEKNNGRKI